MNLFDFVEKIGGTIKFNGSLDSSNPYVNVYLEIQGKEISIDNTSVFGRNTNKIPSLVEAFKDLARSIEGKKITYKNENNEKVVILVPEKLTGL